MNIWVLLVIVVVLIVLLLIAKSRKKPAKADLNLMTYLGGKDNILDAAVSGSQLVVHVKDTRILDHDKIRELGASGIVVSDKKVSMIFGKMADQYYEALKKGGI